MAAICVDRLRAEEQGIAARVWDASRFRGRNAESVSHRERAYVYIGQIDKNVTSDDKEWWLAENRLLSPHQLETLQAICAFFGDADHPICVGDIYVEIVPDPFFGGDAAVRGAKLRRPTYEDYYRKELSSLEEWLARVE
jgi:hypothetical protein